MILATIRARSGWTADLTQQGWRLRGAIAPEFSAMLDRFASLSEFGPSEGDPVARAAAAAAKLVGGEAVFVRTPDPAPAGTVF